MHVMTPSSCIVYLVVVYHREAAQPASESGVATRTLLLRTSVITICSQIVRHIHGVKCTGRAAVPRGINSKPITPIVQLACSISVRIASVVRARYFSALYFQTLLRLTCTVWKCRPRQTLANTVCLSEHTDFLTRTGAFHLSAVRIRCTRIRGL